MFRNSLTLWAKKLGKQDGQALVMFGAGLAGFIGVVGLSVDIGHVMFAKSDLQRTADAAALAGAQDLPNTSAATTTVNTFVGSNSAEAGTVKTIAFTQTYVANDTIRVTTTRTVNHWFLSVIGLNSTSPTATAKVRAGTYQGGNGLLPWGFIASNLDKSKLLQNPCYLGQTGGVPTFQQNVSCTLKHGAGGNTGGGNAGGDFGSLALDGTGGDLYREAVQYGSDTKFKVGDQVAPQTGDTQGPTNQGLDARFARPAPAGCAGNARSDVLITDATGRTKIKAGCEGSPRIVIIPVVDRINDPGLSTILGFAFMFLTGTSGQGGHKSVHGEFIKFTTELPGDYDGLGGNGPKIARVLE